MALAISLTPLFFWQPWYRLSGAINVITAIVSWATVAALIRHLPEAVRLPGALRLSRERAEQITELEKTQQELRSSEARFRTLANNVPLIIFTAARDGAVDFLNATYFQITGRDKTRALGSGWMESIHPEDLPRFRSAWTEALAGAQPFSSECRLSTARGDCRWYLIRAVPPGAESSRWVGFAADITAQKEDAERQVKLERHLQERQKLESLGVLAGGVAHDFNNLLTGILGGASLAQMSLPQQHPVSEHLQLIEQTALRAADLCRQMLAYSGKGRFVISRIDLSRLIEETTTLIQSSISKKAVIRYDLQTDLPSCEGDATQLRQVIMNLVLNASDAIGDRSGFINIHTGSIRADEGYLRHTFGASDLQPGDYVYVEVSDNGCGMTPETLSRIFDPFFTTKFTGRGLGLAAVLGIIKGHKGGIRVHSEVGKGTTFKLLIPASDGPAGNNDPLSLEGGGWKSHGTILVVDDEETLRSVVSLILERWGFKCMVASDGREALELLKVHAADIRCVLMDLTMPHLDGEQTYREMRHLNLTTPVVLMSGFSEQEAVRHFSGRGLAGFVQKPFQPHQLQAILRQALGEN